MYDTFESFVCRNLKLGSFTSAAEKNFNLIYEDLRSHSPLVYSLRFHLNRIKNAKVISECFAFAPALAAAASSGTKADNELLIVCHEYYDNEVFQIAIKCKFSFNWPECSNLLHPQAQSEMFIATTRAVECITSHRKQGLSAAVSGESLSNSLRNNEINLSSA